MNKTISHAGKSWQLHSETESKLVFVPASIPLVRWRKNRKLTQRDAAPILGISQAQLARIESGTRICPPELLTKIQNELQL